MADDAFAPVRRVAALLQGFQRPWCVAGGWAIDLFLDRVTRPHADVDVCILRPDQDTIRSHLSDWAFAKVVRGCQEPWDRTEWLEGPVHEIHARPPGGGPPLEILLDEATDGLWVFRRDARIMRPLSAAILQTEDRIPFLSPEIVLLYKARDHAAKDDADFGFARRGLDRVQASWLRRALEACHPGHPWIDLL